MTIIKNRTDKEPVCSADIKKALCNYFYTKRNCIYFCKEMLLQNDTRADFIALNHFINKAIEVEIKISWSDFMADFKNKKQKHIAYNFGNAPVNYFAFCVPLDIYDKCKEFLDKNYPKYGLFIYSNHSVCQDRISVFSQKKLLTERTTAITKDSVAKQMAIHIIYGN